MRESASSRLPGFTGDIASSCRSLISTPGTSLGKNEPRRREPERNRFSSHIDGHRLVEIQDIGNFNFGPGDDFFFNQIVKEFPILLSKLMDAPDNDWFAG